ncbi:neuropeptide FF receptor 2-like [Stylophora pistillata]|uniref:neuropeptide FF receptor 2-like n=1 Tax=Stylophora pistillata TaxID=50429 RepID=UPI000C03DFD0|nr:neuropeptide FF receptor 2-like [Stylophora pistillata]
MEEAFASNNVTDHTRESSSQLPALRMIEVVLYFTISAVGITANSMIFHSLLSRHSLRVGEYLILNLALTDLATCAVSIPFDLTERLMGGFPYGSIMCYVVYPLQTVLMAVSVITLLSMSLERRRIVMKPFLRPRVLPRKAKIAICVSWIAPILVIIPYALVLRLDGENCVEKWPEHWHVRVFTLTNFTIFFVIPIVVIATSYFRAGKKVRMELEKLNDMLEGSNRSKRDYTRKRTIQKLKVTKMFIIVVVTFFVCMLPTHLVWIWHDFAQGQQNTHFQDLLTFSNIAMYLNSALNPFIFRSVRGKSFTRLIACCCKKFGANSRESWMFPCCVDTHHQMSQVERERAIRVTRQSLSGSSDVCDLFEVFYETSV